MVPPSSISNEAAAAAHEANNNHILEAVSEQSIFIIRHGDRWDYSHPEWKESAERKGDPPLSTLGHRQAREVGRFLDQLFVKEGIKADDVTLLSSPFLRCIQTSNEMLSEMYRNGDDDVVVIPIKTEYSIFEFDLWNDGLHHSLPTMKERKNYFPRLDESYQSSFVPAVPESVQEFLKRCEDTIDHLERREGEYFLHRHHQQQQQHGSNDFKSKSKPVLILVTHAACCIGLVKAATKSALQDINPAAPCSIYRLKRKVQVHSNHYEGDSHDGGHDENHEKKKSSWEMDHFSEKDGFNGFTGHLKEHFGNTFPWNHFERNEKNRGVIGAGYTGPPQQN